MCAAIACLVISEPLYTGDVRQANKRTLSPVRRCGAACMAVSRMARATAAGAGRERRGWSGRKAVGNKQALRVQCRRGWADLKTLPLQQP